MPPPSRNAIINYVRCALKMHQNYIIDCMASGTLKLFDRNLEGNIVIRYAKGVLCVHTSNSCLLLVLTYSFEIRWQNFPSITPLQYYERTKNFI